MIRSFAALLVATSAAAQEAPGAQPPEAIHAEPEKKKPDDSKSKPVTESFGDGTLGLLLQGWFAATTDTAFQNGLPGARLTRSGQVNAGGSTFRLRRVEMSYDGKLLAGLIKYRAMLDPSQINNGPLAVSSTVSGATATGTVSVANVLQDASVSIVPIPQLEIKLGQFKIPLTGEGYGSSGKLDFAERAVVTRQFGDARDLGVMLSTDKLDYVEAQLAVVNGSGKNVFDNGPAKDVIGRVVFHPVKFVSIGGSGYVGKTLGNDSRSYRLKNRLGAEVAVEYLGALLKAEYMGGRDEEPNAAYVRKPVGYFVTAGYRLGAAQIVARYEKWDSDSDASSDQCAADVSGTARGAFAESNRCVKSHAVTLGANYDFAPAVLHAAKLQLDWQYDTDESHGVSAHEVVLNTQVKF